MPSESRALVVVVAGVALATLLGGACNRGPKTPEDAYRRFAEAVRARDAGGLFDALDQETRWSWMTIQKSHRESYDIVMSTFPEGSERTRQLARFEAGATSESAKALFTSQFGDTGWGDLAKGLTDSPRITAGDVEATVELAPEVRLVLRKGKDGRWGYTGLARHADQVKRRAIADLDLLRTSAADYERAATRGGK